MVNYLKKIVDVIYIYSFVHLFLMLKYVVRNFVFYSQNKWRR